MRRLISSVTAALVLMPAVVSAQALRLGPAARPIESMTSFAAHLSLQAPVGRQRSFDPEVTGSLGRAAPAGEVDIVRKCRRAVVAAALPYGVAQVDAIGAGPLMPIRNGYVAPIAFSIVYARGGARESRRATIECFLDTARRVTSVR
jgi:hypothetical protein